MSKSAYLSLLLGLGAHLPINAFAQDNPAENSDDKSGWYAADEYWDPAEMARARAMVKNEHGGMKTYFAQVERLEYRTKAGDDVALWDGQAWYGGDRNKIWVKTEGEFSIGDNAFEEGEIQALWSRAMTPFFDFQMGIRQDFASGHDDTYAVVGIQGLAPYWFEIDGAIFVSDDGDVTAKFEAEYELLLTQRLILQPRSELSFAAQMIDEKSLGSGLSKAEMGLRLRYEFTREFAPYIGVSWERSIGETADFLRAESENPSAVSFVAGLRLMF